MLAVEMIWQAPENKALGISVITTRDSCDMSCTNSEGVVMEAKRKSFHCPFQQSMCTFKTKECKSIIL